jgi:hypothetical protein
MDRVSPSQLIRLIEITNSQYVNTLAALDPFAYSRFSVVWAGEEESSNWFHIAREYTEKWHHQQQIRDAVNKPGLMSKELFYPCIDTFMRGLPHTYRNVNANTGTLIEINITTDVGGTWYLKKMDTGWILFDNLIKSKPNACVTIEPDVAWKLFTKGIKPELALEKSIITGNTSLAKNVFNMISVMA